MRLPPFSADLNHFRLSLSIKSALTSFAQWQVFNEVSRNVDLGDETTTMMRKFVIHVSDASVKKEIGSDLQGWLDDITDGGVEYMPEGEVKVAAAER